MQAPTIAMVRTPFSSVQRGEDIVVEVTLTAPAGGIITFATSPAAGGITSPPTRLSVYADVTTLRFSCSATGLGAYTVTATLTSPVGNTATKAAASEIFVYVVSRAGAEHAAHTWHLCCHTH